MRVIDIPYNQYVEEWYPHKHRVRDLAECTIWSVGGQPPRLILEDPVNRRAALFEYETLAEREKDIRLVLKIDEHDGGASSGIPAWLSPVMPTRSAGFAEPFPSRGGDDE